jgi:hypothetical protein
MKPTASSFERLERTITIIAQHADYPGKPETIAECREDIEDRWTRGLLDLEKRFGLLAILVRGSSPLPPREIAGAC